MGQDQAGAQAARLGQRYTAQRLDAACRRGLDAYLIEVRRVERITCPQGAAGLGFLLVLQLQLAPRGIGQP